MAVKVAAIAVMECSGGRNVSNNRKSEDGSSAFGKSDEMYNAKNGE